MNTTERAALEHENWIAYLTGVVRCTKAARVHRDGGAVTILSDMPFDWFNQVLIERLNRPGFRGDPGDWVSGGLGGCL